jgi:hypothetical protein
LKNSRRLFVTLTWSPRPILPQRCNGVAISAGQRT